MPHEARTVLLESGSNQRIVVPYVLKNQHDTQIFSIMRWSPSEEQSEIMRKFMVRQLVTVEFERISSRLKFNKQWEAPVAENKEISNYYDKVIQLQNKLLDRLNPQCIPKTLQDFLGKIKPFFQELNRAQFAVDRAA